MEAVVPSSMADAEYLEIGFAAQECIWISHLLAFVTDRGITQPEIFVENLGTIRLAEKDASGNRTRDIAPEYSWVRDLLNEKSSN